MTIGVFFGSRSPEHDISIITGQLIIAGLKQLGHAVISLYIGKDGDWHIGDELGSINFFQQHENLQPYGGWQLELAASREKMVFKKKGLWSKTITIDIAFPAFHGRNGEDGTAQGLFELCGIPYVGCDVPSSAITMDKVLTKLLYEQHGVPTTTYIYFYKQDWEKNKDALLQKIQTGLRWPLFVKPARLGSSIGIAKARTEQELVFAIEVALHYDEKVLVEEGIENVMDVTCAVIGNNDPQPSLLQESVFGDAFFSYEDKYLKGGGAQFGKARHNIIIPARLDDAITEHIRTMAIYVFKLLGCSGIARVDFLYDKDTKKIYANEVNPLPGTLYHHLWDTSGVPLKELLTRLIACALEHHRAQQKITATFESDILKQTDWSQKLQKQ